MTQPPDRPDSEDEAAGQAELEFDAGPEVPDQDGVFEPPWEPASEPPAAPGPPPHGPAASLPPPPPPRSRESRDTPSRAEEAPSEAARARRPAGPTPPPPADRPFAPVIFDDDQRGGPPPPFAEYDDSGVLRVLGVIVLLAIAIAVMVLPPISILDRGGSEGTGGLSVQARGELPELPGGLVAVSQLYDLNADDDLTDQDLWTLSIKLSEVTQDGRNLAFYSYHDDEWIRLTSATLANGGSQAEAEVSDIPENVAVLRRVAFERTLGLIVDAGEIPDPAALASSPVVTVMAGTLGVGDDGAAALTLFPDAIDAAAAGGATVYLGVDVDPEAAAALDQLLSTEPATVAHVGELIAAVQEVNADGLYLAYLDVDRTRAAGLTRLVTQLGSGLSEAGLGLVIGVPTPATADTGAYDWPALLAASGGIWLNAPDDPSVYYEQLQVVLEAQQAAGVELDGVSLVIGRMSHIRDSEGVSEIGRYDALGRAAQLEAGAVGGIAVSDLVSLTAINTAEELGNSGVRWDSPSRMVSFAFAERGGPRTVWVENSFSLAFKLDLAQRYDLGGVVIADAQADETLPAVWELLAGYLDSGSVTLMLPYGPYLTPCWQALDGVIEGEAGNCWSGATVSGTATWRAPATPGAYAVRLVVSDGEVFVGRELVLLVTEEGEQVEPTPEPTAEPTQEATPEATEEPTQEPSAEATAAPTDEPTTQPTAEPTVASTPPPSGTQGPPGPGGNE